MINLLISITIIAILTLPVPSYNINTPSYTFHSTKGVKFVEINTSPPHIPRRFPQRLQHHTHQTHTNTHTTTALFSSSSSSSSRSSKGQDFFSDELYTDSAWSCIQSLPKSADKFRSQTVQPVMLLDTILNEYYDANDSDANPARASSDYAEKVLGDAGVDVKRIRWVFLSIANPLSFFFPCLFHLLLPLLVLFAAALAKLFLTPKTPLPTPHPPHTYHLPHTTLR